MRTVHLRLPERELIIDKLLELEWNAEHIEHATNERNRLIHECVGMGCPVRTIGRYAKLSGAQVSRLTSGRA